MPSFSDSLRDGAIVDGRYQVRRTLASDEQVHLLAAVDDGGARPELRVLLARPAGVEPDLRQSGALDAGSLCAPLLDSFEADGQPVLVLGANGGLTLADPAPSANDTWLAHVLLVLTQLISDLARAGADLDQVTLGRVLLVAGEPGLLYVGPVLPATSTPDLPATLARLRDDLLAMPGTWSNELRLRLALWREGRLGSFTDILGHLSDLCDPPTLSADVALVSDAGRVRRQNEDAALRIAEQSLTGHGAVDWSLVALADGMGGHRGGRLASQLALHTLATSLTWQGANAALEGHAPRWDDNASVVALLLAAVDEAHRAVAGLADAGEERAPGCTLTAALLVDRRLFFAHVGDSRAYLLRDGRLEQLTRDDTWVQGLVDGGDLTIEQARAHPSGHVLTQALGQPVELRPMVGLRLMWPGDRLLLCSDGVTESLTDAALAELLGESRPPAEVAEAVVTAAIAAGSRDNVTAVVEDLS